MPHGSEPPRVRVTLRVAGGVAYMPGLTRPRTVDSADLPGDERAGLLDALGAVGLLPGTSAVTPPPPPDRGADRQTYTVTVDCAGERREVAVSDPVSEEPYLTLVRMVRRLTRPGR